MSERHTLLHEAGHAVFTVLFGWVCNGITTEPGEYSNGVCRSVPPSAPPGTFDPVNIARPFFLWPEAARRLLEARTMIVMGGDVAADLLDDPDARVPDTVAVRIVEQMAELPEPGMEERAELAAMVNDEDAPSDEDQVTKMVWAAHGGDLASAKAWLDYLYRQVRQIVRAEADRILALADVLAVQPTLTGEMVAALLRDRP